MSAYTRKTRCATVRCQHCSWVATFFAVDHAELMLRAAMEQVFHLFSTHKVLSLGRTV
jgi:hypothetical protein